MERKGFFLHRNGSPSRSEGGREEEAVVEEEKEIRGNEECVEREKE